MRKINSKTGIENFGYFRSYNSDPIIKKLDKINNKMKAMNISTFDFSTLYTTLPHTDLVKALSEIIDFVFKGGRKTLTSVNKYSAY